ncbi:oligosaccharide biosynthesis protein Alg14 [Adhaeribacter terreus]|uniref:Oligosaccharide biosynthesis protein Alg14 n=1 Tax=Adhaeribacter terreus TaxID=529703 RepID=A0ABW0ECE6_9BACT
MKILAIASAGGHWIQLLRLLSAFEGHDISFMSTKASFASTVNGMSFYAVPDANRWNKLKLIYLAFRVAKVVYTLKPQVIISTGAAPGLMGIIAGKLLGSKTIWVDSIANVEKVSLSGKIALHFADKVYTQWPDLATQKITFAGNVLS